MRVGFLQGRLSPRVDGRIQAFPKDTWRDEFLHAKRVGFGLVELIYDTLFLDENPLYSQAGRRELRQLASETDVTLGSICADFFMNRLLLNSSGEIDESSYAEAIRLFDIAEDIRCPLVEFPFVDSSSIQDPVLLKGAKKLLARLIEDTKRSGIRFALETDLNPDEFSGLIEGLSTESLGVNYDTGNSASLGYAADQEWAAYGDRVFNVHIKDRVLGGTTVPVGTGDTRFEDVFRAIASSGYQGDFILQTCPDPDYIAVAVKYRQLVESWIDEYQLRRS